MEHQNNQKPGVYIKSISFNDKTTLPITRNSIIVFTGANNSGKSQVLKDIERYLNKVRTNYNPKVITQIDFDFMGDVDNEFLRDHFYIDPTNRNYKMYESSDYSYQKDDILNSWKGNQLFDNLHRLFIKLINTKQRLITSNALQRMNNPECHPIYQLHNSQDLAQTLSVYFHQAFGVELVVNRNNMRDIPLHIGNPPDTSAYTIANQDTYYAEIEKLPRLDEQGDGMRSFTSILLDTFTSKHTITLIDEPEAFLHPPQARLLGKMLAKNNPSERQLFISTHSEDFLQGLLDADNDNTTVIRINRKENINHMSILQNFDIAHLWSNPLLRYTNILNGLFYEKVVVCESDYDCLFYKSIMDATYEHRSETAPDIMFTHCGGKDRIKTVVAALRVLNVIVVAITDFDLLNNSSKFKDITNAFKINWSEKLDTPMKTIYNYMNTVKDSWKNIKLIGKQGFNGEAPKAYETVESICCMAGLFIVPYGEIESFDKTVNKSKKDWVYYVLENYDLANELKLSNAREFIQRVVDYNFA